MRRILVLDTWVNDTNIGNQIISEAVDRHLKAMFPEDFFYLAAGLDRVGSSRHLMASADRIFFAGTNLLRSDMDNRDRDWPINMDDAEFLRNLILVGVGWWQYQETSFNRYTEKLLKRILHPALPHATRDSYTQKRLRDAGYLAVNTGCPSLWDFTPDFVGGIRREKSDTVLLTLTEYSQKPELDRALIDLLRREYRSLLFWPQQFGDLEYFKSLCRGEYQIVPPTLQALDRTLESQPIDFVGTRLHGGIRALQKRQRALVLGIDNRAIEMGRDFGLPVIARSDLAQLGQAIGQPLQSQIKMDLESIESWKLAVTRGHSVNA